MPDANGGYEEVVERERQSFLTFIFKPVPFFRVSRMPPGNERLLSTCWPIWIVAKVVF